MLPGGASIHEPTSHTLESHPHGPRSHVQRFRNRRSVAQPRNSAVPTILPFPGQESRLLRGKPRTSTRDDAALASDTCSGIDQLVSHDLFRSNPVPVRLNLRSRTSHLGFHGWLPCRGLDGCGLLNRQIWLGGRLDNENPFM
jgi:hypothetical protein